MSSSAPITWGRESVLQFLDAQGIGYREARHKAVCTMAESAALDLPLTGCRCKNLLVQGKRGTNRFLVLTPAEASVDLGALGRTLVVGRLSLCPPDEMLRLLGVAPGAMSPFALVADTESKVRLLMDAQLGNTRHFLFHPFVNTATVAIDANGLGRFLAATGHSLEIVAMPRRTTAVDASA